MGLFDELTQNAKEWAGNVEADVEEGGIDKLKGLASREGIEEELDETMPGHYKPKGGRDDDSDDDATADDKSDDDGESDDASDDDSQESDDDDTDSKSDDDSDQQDDGQD